MDRLIWSNLDFDHQPVTSEARIASRKARASNKPRPASSYRGAKRNAKSRAERKTTVVHRTGKVTKYGTAIFSGGSLDGSFVGKVGLNRSRHWKPADNYYDARDLSQSNREVV